MAHCCILNRTKDGVFDSGCLTLAALCNEAVDYPKNGVKVDLQQMPRRLIHAKPDWKKVRTKRVSP